MPTTGKASKVLIAVVRQEPVAHIGEGSGAAQGAMIAAALALMLGGMPTTQAAPLLPDGETLWHDAGLNAEARPLIVTQGGSGMEPADHVTPHTRFTGVGDLIIDRTDFRSRCTTSRIGARTILTAAHCIADEYGNVVANAASVTFTTAAGLSEVHQIATLSQAQIHPDYTGDALKGFDVAVLELATTPSETVETYRLLRDHSADIGAVFDLVGFGRSGTGSSGDVRPSGIKRDGRNRFDADGTVLEQLMSVSSERLETLLLFDFDNGLPENDAFGFFFGEDFADTGLPDEVFIAPGDSGGPNFINNRIAAVNSFGLRLSTASGANSDIDGVLNSTWGEFAGSARVAHPEVSAWIDAQPGGFSPAAAQVPAPATPLLLLIGLMVAGVYRWLTINKNHS